MTKYPVSYKVKIREPESHYYHVDITIEQAVDEVLDLKMAAWLPGAYRVTDFAKNVEKFSAYNSRGETLKWEKTDKQTWRVQTEKGMQIHISYDLYAFQLEDDDNYLCSDFAIFNPGSALMSVQDFYNDPSKLSIALPEQWQRISTGMPGLNEEEHAYYASSYHELMDYPMLMGNHEVRRFMVNGIVHSSVIWRRSSGLKSI